MGLGLGSGFCGTCEQPSLTRKLGDTYVLRCEPYVKIGIARDVRLRAYQLTRYVLTGNHGTYLPAGLAGGELGLAALFAGDIEHQLHERFVDAHVLGEWFEAEPVIAALPELLAAFPSVTPEPCLCDDCIAEARLLRRRELRAEREESAQRWAAASRLVIP